MDASLVSLVGDGDLDAVKRHLDSIRRIHGQAIQTSPVSSTALPTQSHALFRRLS